ncbi:hypothetical protein PVAND_010426 [Polypedilum vanderplanki]|uniref:Uncharacterized protein n=1 Tax=Polypedilum vanderplanki TaxID=319348 RepID=A0A9J6CGD8_POLVA|nr:hypothetical protein PVAND_010426 [Polypedilum vanderplanki]
MPSDGTKYVEPEKLLTKDEPSKPKDLKEKSRTPSPSKDDKILPSDGTKHVEPEKLLTKGEPSKPKDLKEKSRTPSPSKDDKILPSDDTKHVEPEKLLTKDESSKPKDLKEQFRPSAPEIQEIDSLKTITQREFVTGFTKQEKVIHEVTTVIKEHVEKSLFDEPKKEEPLSVLEDKPKDLKEKITYSITF